MLGFIRYSPLAVRLIAASNSPRYLSNVSKLGA